MEFLILFQVYCDMVSVDQAWTLIARFSNSDAKNWMDDSGDWWYDSIQPAGETADLSYKADMISPAFWLVCGSEIKITRSDDSGHTPLLGATGNCLSGKTFRSKMTSNGDFRNGSVWSNGLRLGKCNVLYMEGNTKQPKVSDRLHAAVTCKVLMRSASGVAENGAVL